MTARWALRLRGSPQGAVVLLQGAGGADTTLRAAISIGPEHGAIDAAWVDPHHAREPRPRHGHHRPEPPQEHGRRPRPGLPSAAEGRGRRPRRSGARHPRAAAYVHPRRGSSPSRIAVFAGTMAPWRLLEHSLRLNGRLGCARGARTLTPSLRLVTASRGDPRPLVAWRQDGERPFRGFQAQRQRAVRGRGSHREADCARGRGGASCRTAPGEERRPLSSVRPWAGAERRST